MRIIKKSIAAVLCAAMVITLAPASAGAAKKPSIKKKVSVAVGETVTIKVKKAVKKAKVTWKTSDKKVVKIAKKVTKGKKASATIKGVAEGTAKIKATYKVGKKKTKLTCNVTVTAAAKVDPTVAPGTQAPSAAPATDAPATEAPTKGPTNTPRPSATPSPAPVNEGVTARQMLTGKTIKVDGVKDAEEYEDADGSFDLLVNDLSVRGDSNITAATATLMWKSNALYALVEVKGGDSAKDEVILYTADGDKVVSSKATIGKIAGGYVAEATVALKDAAVDGTAKFEIQINNGDATINYFDSVTAIEYDAEEDKWNFKDEGVKAAEDTSVYGTVTFVKAMEQPTVAYYTDKGAEMLAAADLDNGEWNTDETLKSKTMTFIDTAFWTDVYEAADADSINFAKGNIPDHKGNIDEVTLADVQEDGTLVTDRKYAQAYTIWDEEYLYVLYDIKDTDISPATAEFYDSDSVEFFLDEDYSRPTVYGEGDEVQLRVGAIDNYFSANSAGTGELEMVAHAVKITEGVGYQVQMIIKFVDTHAEGDMMGMDLQVNDCYTIPGVDGAEDTGDRACTLTAYDTTNLAYENPSCFGRIKLVK